MLNVREGDVKLKNCVHYFVLTAVKQPMITETVSWVFKIPNFNCKKINVILLIHKTRNLIRDIASFRSILLSFVICLIL